MGTINNSMEGSNALQLIVSKGWNWKNSNDPNIELEVCPFCKKSGYGHFYQEIHGTTSERRNRDGLFLCQKCGKSGNLHTLKQHLGLSTAEVGSTKDWASSETKIDALPNVEACHELLLADADAMDYLMNIRGFSRKVIEQQKLGLKEKHFFKGLGEIRALVFPYLINGNTVFAHFRSLPDPNDLTKVEKAFNSPRGYDAVLYNGHILKEGLKEVVFVEGEMDTICALDNGILNVCGVPGANIRKAEWIDKIDSIGLEKIYICYDSDKVGQKAAQTLAVKIGIERCYKIQLPAFTTLDGKIGKDLNEWFKNGGTLEAFEQLKQDADLFDVDGVSSSADALEEFEDELDGKGSGQKYATPWPSLSKIVRFDEGDIIDIIAPEKIGKTTMGLNIMEFMVDTYGEDGVIICLEMTRARMARKWLCHKTGIPDVLATTIEEEKALTSAFKQAIPSVKQMAANREGNLYFCYPKYKSAEDIYNLIVACIRRYGVKWVMIDNLQLLCDATIGTRSRTQYLSEISKSLAKIGKDYNIQMLRILQPHRIAAGKVATSDNVDGSSQIAKDCDCMLVANRARLNELEKDTLQEGAFVQTEGTFGNDFYVGVGLSRYSAGGSTTLYYEGATSSIYEQAEGKVAAMKAKSMQAGKGDLQNTLETLSKYSQQEINP